MASGGRRGLGRDQRSRRQARLVGAVGFTLAATLPWIMWRRVIGIIASQFTLDWNYFLSELSPFILIAAGILFFVPVAFSAGRDPESRWYPQARAAYAGWGITLYLLGLALGTQVAQIASTTAP